MALSTKYLIVLFLVVVLFSNHAHAFGAGNIASISSIEGKNWRHGDIEDMLKTVAFIKHHKWTSVMIKRVYFGNWLRDYSQAMDVGTLKGCPGNTIRVLVWILSFMSFGYATAEFEVTDERLGVYRPEEHIDNPRDYADNIDARHYDQRLRPPVRPVELEIDPRTGMKNYIANEHGDWATSSAYVKRSFARSIEYGRKYAASSTLFSKGNEADLCEALRCLGQGLHCLEDFGAHTNYVELALREMGFTNVFPHVGTNTQIMLGGKHVFPLVTGTFGGVDFLHSVLGEATDHVAQSEVSELEQLNKALADASATERTDRGFGGGSSAAGEASYLTDMLGKIPGTGGLCQEAVQLQRASDAQAQENATTDRAGGFMSNMQQLSTAPEKVDVQATVKKIYPILEFRDKVVRFISSVVSKIPGLESLIENVQERITLFIMSLLAPYIQPLIAVASKNLKLGSSTVVEASGRHQYEPWTDPNCTDPTHSLLSKDHFSNVLNPPAGRVAATILMYCAPRVLYAWEHAEVPVQQVMADIEHVFHHPAVRKENLEVQHNMFTAVKDWMLTQPNRGADLNHLLSAESVREGKNHQGGDNPHLQSKISNNPNVFGLGSHSKVSGSPFAMFTGGSSKTGADLFADDGSGAGPESVPPHPNSNFPDQKYPPSSANQPSPYAPSSVDLHSPYPPSSVGPHSPYPPSGAGHESPYPPPPAAAELPAYPAYGSEQSNTYPPTDQNRETYNTGTTYPPQGYENNAYPPHQQGFGEEGGGYPPQQNSGEWDPYGTQQQSQQSGYQNDPYGYQPQQQPPPQDPNNPYPQHQQGFGGGGGGGYGGY